MYALDTEKGLSLMYNLRNIELQTLSNVLLDLYEATEVNELMDSFLSNIRELIPYEQSSFQVVNLDENNFCVTESVFKNVKEEFKELFYELSSDQNYLKNLFACKNSIVYLESSLIEESIRHKIEFYKKFFKPQNLEYAAGIVLIKDSRKLGVISFFRSKQWGDFSEKEIFFLDILKAHLANSVSKLISMKQNEPALDEQLFTSREREIIQLLINGCTNEEIAKELFISVSTIKKHIYNIFNKYGVHNRVALIKKLHSE